MALYFYKDSIIHPKILDATIWNPATLKKMSKLKIPFPKKAIK